MMQFCTIWMTRDISHVDSEHAWLCYCHEHGQILLMIMLGCGEFKPIISWLHSVFFRCLLALGQTTRIAQPGDRLSDSWSANCFSLQSLQKMKMAAMWEDLWVFWEKTWNNADNYIGKYIVISLLQGYLQEHLTNISDIHQCDTAITQSLEHALHWPDAIRYQPQRNGLLYPPNIILPQAWYPLKLCITKRQTY